MPDPIYEDPRLAAVYDELDPDRSDLNAYVAIADELQAQSILDVGCGTGTFALLLADRGKKVVGLEPAAQSLAVARAKPGADQVSWICGFVSDLPDLQVDLVTMTANVTQVLLDDDQWHRALSRLCEVLTPEGHLVFEVRDPGRRAWLEWETTDVIGDIETTCTVADVRGELVSFRWTFTFRSDGHTVASDSTLRFRDRPTIEKDLERAGFTVLDVREAPDRPGREHVFVASPLRPRPRSPHPG